MPKLQQPNVWTTRDTEDKWGLGSLFVDEKDNKKYRYVKNTGAGALSTAKICAWDGASGKDNGNVVDAGAASKVGPAGLPMAALAAGEFGFIQVSGKSSKCDCSAAVAAGKAAMAEITSNVLTGKFITQTAGHAVVAVNDGETTAGDADETLRLCFE